MAKFEKGDHVQDINDSTKYGTVEKVFPLEGGESNTNKFFGHILMGLQVFGRMI